MSQLFSNNLSKPPCFPTTTDSLKLTAISPAPENRPTTNFQVRKPLVSGRETPWVPGSAVWNLTRWALPTRISNQKMRPSNDRKLRPRPRPARLGTLPETNIFAPWKWMVGSDEFPFGVKGIFSGAFAVSFREGQCGFYVFFFCGWQGGCWSCCCCFSMVLQSKICCEFCETDDSLIVATWKINWFGVYVKARFMLFPYILCRVDALRNLRIMNLGWSFLRSSVWSFLNGMTSKGTPTVFNF